MIDRVEIDGSHVVIQLLFLMEHLWAQLLGTKARGPTKELWLGFYCFSFTCETRYDATCEYKVLSRTRHFINNLCSCAPTRVIQTDRLQHFNVRENNLTTMYQIVGVGILHCVFDHDGMDILILAMTERSWTTLAEYRFQEQAHEILLVQEGLGLWYQSLILFFHYRYQLQWIGCGVWGISCAILA